MEKNASGNFTRIQAKLTNYQIKSDAYHASGMINKTHFYLLNEYLGSQKYAKGSKLQFHVMTIPMTPP